MIDTGSFSDFGVVLARLGAAAVIGGIVGLNREMHGKPAGVRTLALVGLGAALATYLSIEVTASGKVADMGAVTRVIQGVLTGVGFLGAGVIFRGEDSKQVTGLTTAATVWVVACLGIACGAGRWHAVIAATLLTLIILVLGGPFEKLVDALPQRNKQKAEPVDSP